MTRLASFVLLSCVMLASSRVSSTQHVSSPQQPSTAAVESAVLQARHADKLAQPFLRVAPWHHDLASAQRQAAATGKLILVHGTRSFQPCGTSIRCEREVLASPAFVAFADEVVLYCHVSAHVDAVADQQLAAWRGSGWPHHVVLDATGRVLGVHDSHRDKTVDELRTLVAAARTFLQVEQATRIDEAAARQRRLRAGLSAGALSLGEARSLFADCGVLSADEAKTLAAALTDLEVAEVLGGEDRFDPATATRVGAVFATMHSHGKRPAARNAARDFWGGLLLHLEARERPNLPLQREALDELERRFGTEAGYRTFLAERRAALQQREAAASSGAAVVPAAAPATPVGGSAPNVR